MNPSLVTFVRYNNWANRRLFEVTAQLDEAVLREPSPFFDLGTPWHSLLHLLDVEWSWLRAARGLDMRAYIWELEPLPDLAALSDFQRRFAAEMEEYVASLDDDALAERVDIGAPRGAPPKWVSRATLILHIVNHGTQHRSELAHFLTSLGHSPGDIDDLDFATGAVG